MRHSTIWFRKGRGWFTTVDKKQIPLGRDRKEAERAFYLARSRDQPITHGTHSVPELVSLYLTWVADRVRPKTYSRYYESLMPWARSMAKVKPSALRAYHLTSWLEGHKRWNATTRTTRGTAVKTWASWIESEGFVDANRLRGARLPGNVRREHVDGAELVKLDRAITEEAFGDFYRVLRDTGCRPGELAGLEAAQCSFSTSSAIVAGKTGPRVVGLSPRAVEILRRCAERFPTGPLLRTMNAALWSKENQKRTFGKWCRIAGTVHIRPYDARRGLWARWYAAGISDVVISKQLGHSLRGVHHQLALLVSTYAHVDALPLAKAARECELWEQGQNEPGTSKRQRRRG